ncbi:MAG: metallophosphoesterase [Opitutae bacterium]|nr:metallophosphoesterase [Opitutae bacterium]
MNLNRRTFLRRAGGALALAATTGLAVPSAQAAPNPRRRRLLRAAHLTDIHVSPDNHAPEGMIAALRHAQGQPDKPDLLLFGGDCIGDALETPKPRVLEQWELWDRIMAAELKTPACQCIGNHDIFGWKQRNVPGLPDDPAYGKALALQHLGLKERYYSFDRSSWHFVVLDSMELNHGNNQGYNARLDDGQFAWLTSDLAATPAATPVCVLSHIPILSPAAYFDGANEGTGTWIVPGAWMHIDARRIKDLFKRHPNVKVCLSGHLHMEDDATYLGVRYLCNGAVCGGWWKGRNQEFGPAYALIDFFDDGSVENRLVAYGA